MKKIKKTLALILIVAMIMSMSACNGMENDSLSPMKQPFQFVFNAFDTNCFMSIYTNTEQDEDMTIAENLKMIVQAFEKSFSRTLPGSDIYEINHRASDSVMITDLTATLFEIAPGLYEWSGEKFDISAGTLVDLWDIKNRKTLPTAEEIKEAKRHCKNYAYTIERDVEPDYVKCNRITFYGDPLTQYDFGALVKGYCSDSLRAAINENDKIKAAIINLGGNVVCAGRLSDRKGGSFNVGIADPASPSDIISTVKVLDKCVITSGNYQRYFKVPGDDKKYHHIIDTETGYPSDNELDSVSIISENGTLGDYLSTACMLLGIEKSKLLIDFSKKQFGDKNLQAVFVTKDRQIIEYPATIDQKNENNISDK